MSVLVVITNYKRPENVPHVIEGFRNQSVKPDYIVVVDNSPSPPATNKGTTEFYPNPKFHQADDVWRLTRNLGCPCHYLPALALYEYEYTLFSDDDLIPGYRGIEIALETAKQVNNQFATIGQHGRMFDIAATRKYLPYSTPTPSSHPVKCHTTCRTHLIRTEFMHHAITLRSKMLHNSLYDKKETSRIVGIHDDLLMALGIQLATGYPSYVIPQAGDREKRMLKENLPEPDATWRRPTHFDERNLFVEMALSCGWSPINA